MDAINLANKLSTFSEYWPSSVVGSFHGQALLVVKVKGELGWHKHDDSDDFFLVFVRHMITQLRDSAVRLGPGEIFVVPRGVEHRRHPQLLPDLRMRSPDKLGLRPVLRYLKTRGDFCWKQS